MDNNNAKKKIFLIIIVLSFFLLLLMTMLLGALSLEESDNVANNIIGNCRWHLRVFISEWTETNNCYN